MVCDKRNRRAHQIRKCREEKKNVVKKKVNIGMRNYFTPEAKDN